MKYDNLTDLRQIESAKAQFETALDVLEDFAESPEYEALKELIVKHTGGLELEDVLMDARRFSKGLDDLEATAMTENETKECVV